MKCNRCGIEVSVQSALPGRRDLHVSSEYCIDFLLTRVTNLRAALERIENLGAESSAGEDLAPAMFRVANGALERDDAFVNA